WAILPPSSDASHAVGRGLKLDSDVAAPDTLRSDPGRPAEGQPAPDAGLTPQHLSGLRQRPSRQQGASGTFDARDWPAEAESTHPKDYAAEAYRALLAPPMGGPETESAATFGATHRAASA